jgi:cobalt-zinc-cadmium efflux system membrane fusion protein
MRAWLRALPALLLSHLPAVLTVAVLVGLFFLGDHYGWKLPKFADLWPWADRPDAPNEPDKEREPTGTEGSPSAPGLIRLASAETATKAGLAFAPAEERTLCHEVTAYGALAYDQTRIAQLSTRAAGTVWRVEKQLGDPVRKGEVLALIDAAEVGRVKAEFLTSVVQVGLRTANVEQMRSAAGSVPERLLREAEAGLREARIKLANDQQALANLGLPIRAEDVKDLPDDRLAREVRLLGLPPHVVASVDPNTVTASLLPLRAPFDGLVVGRNVVTGELAAVGQPQFVVADVSQLWVLLDVRREDAGQLARGQEVTFVPDGARDDRAARAAAVVGQLADPGPAGPLQPALAVVPDLGESARGRLSWISPEVDEKTRTVRARAEVTNPQGRLRPNTFGNGRVLVRQKPNAVTVPAEAVQSDGPNSLVFVKLSEQEFLPRQVEVGLRDGRGVEIVSGLQPGEVVVTTGSHVLKTELFKARLGGED